MQRKKAYKSFLLRHIHPIKKAKKKRKMHNLKIQKKSEEKSGKKSKECSRIYPQRDHKKNDFTNDLKYVQIVE